MLQPGRKYTSSSSYRYGFNGKEDDKDAGAGIQDYGMRIYSERLGRFLSEDPLVKTYPYLTPYQFAENSPILFIDLDGLEKALPWYLRENKHGGKPVLTFGLGNLSTTTRIENYENLPISGQTKAGIFAANVLKSAWNSFANTWNDAMDGKTGSQMLVESVQSIEKVKLSDLKKVETWENIAAGILTAYVSKRVSNSIGASATAAQASLIKNRISFAKDFYIKSGFEEADAFSHMNGIDMTKKVFSTTLEKGTVLEQWTYLDANGKPKLGNYYTLQGTDPSTLGIPLEGRVKTSVVLQEATEFLQSTAGDIENWQKPGSGEVLKGGGSQLFQTNVKVEVKTP